MTAVLTRGIDVSHHNGVINWGDKKRRQGISFGMAKCVEGMTFYDPQYVANREGCHLAGMPFLAYGYVLPEKSSALSQAKYLIAKAGDVEGYVMDLEISGLNQSETRAWQHAYGDDLMATGKPVYGYLGGYSSNGSGADAASHFTGWIYPHYLMNTWPTLYTPRVGVNTTGFAQPTIWQCSDRIDGTDADVSDLTLSQLFSGDAMPTAEEIAQAVWSYNLPTYYPNGATTYALIGQAAKADDALLAVSKLPTADAIAAAVVQALPPSSSGGITEADVVTAVKSVFAQAGATS